MFGIVSGHTCGPKPKLGETPKLSETQLDCNEILLFKPMWGAFFETCLESTLQTLGVDSVVFTGCNFPNCPRTSIYVASERDFKLVLVKDALSGLYERGIEEMRSIGVIVMDTDTMVERILEEK